MLVLEVSVIIVGAPSLALVVAADGANGGGANGVGPAAAAADAPAAAAAADAIGACGGDACSRVVIVDVPFTFLPPLL